MNMYWQEIKKALQHFFTLDDTPRNIAAGFALGVFLGIIPGGILTALILAAFFRFNRISAIAGVLATNTWSTVAIMPFAAVVGGFLFDVTPDHLIQQFDGTYDLGIRYFFTNLVFFDLVLPLLAGFIITASAISLLAYFILYLLLKYKKVSIK